MTPAPLDFVLAFEGAGSNRPKMVQAVGLLEDSIRIQVFRNAQPSVFQPAFTSVSTQNTKTLKALPAANLTMRRKTVG